MSNTHRAGTECWYFRQTPSGLMCSLAIDIDGKPLNFDVHSSQIWFLRSKARELLTSYEGRLKLFRELEFAEARYEKGMAGK